MNYNDLSNLEIGEDGNLILPASAYADLMKRADAEKQQGFRTKASNDAKKILKTENIAEWDSIYNGDLNLEDVDVTPIEENKTDDGNYIVTPKQFKTLASMWESSQLNGERTRARGVADKAIKLANPERYDELYEAQCEELGIEPSTRRRTR